MKFDLSKFKKIHDGDNAAILEHPQGHRISIHKGMLSKDLKEQLEALPIHSYDNPDEIKDPSEDNTQPQVAPPQSPVVINVGGAPQQQQQTPAYDSRQAEMNLLQDPRVGDSVKEAITKKYGLNLNAKQINSSLPQIGGRTPVETQQPEPEVTNQTNIPSTTQTTGAPTAPINNDPYGIIASNQLAGAGIGQQIAAINEGARAEGALGRQQARILNQGITREQQFLNDAQSNLQNSRQEYQKFIQDYSNQHIDPQRYMRSMGTGQKISTAIGLILGGMGGGLLHQENPAMKFLQAQIDNDIRAQQDELSKSPNLLRANLEQQGNIISGAKMTEAMHWGIVAKQIEAAGAQSADPIAQARAKQAIGAIFEQKIAPKIQEAATTQAMLSGANNAAGGGDPERLIPFMVPEKHQESAFKEAGALKANEALKQDVLNSFDDIHSQFLNGALSPKDVYSAKQAFIGRVIKESEGRFNYEAAQALANAIFPTVGETKNTSSKKRERAIALMDSMVQTPILSAYGIRSSMRFAPQQSGSNSQNPFSSRERPPVLTGYKQ